VEFVDPRYNESLEAEAGEQYGIQPVPFQVAGRYEASVVNSYFHILVRYGDQFEILDFRRLVEVQPGVGGGPPEVRLANLEYTLTSTIKKVVQGFQSVGTVLEHIRKPSLLPLSHPGIFQRTSQKSLKSSPRRQKNWFRDRTIL